MLSHTALLHPSQTGISRAVPSREQRQAGTDILPRTSEYPHTQYVPGKRVGGGWPIGALAVYRHDAWGLLQARGPQQHWALGLWSKHNRPLNIHHREAQKRPREFSRIIQKEKWQNLIGNEIREVDLLLSQKAMIAVYIYNTYVIYWDHTVSLCGCTSVFCHPRSFQACWSENLTKQ